MAEARFAELAGELSAHELTVEGARLVSTPEAVVDPPGVPSRWDMSSVEVARALRGSVGFPPSLERDLFECALDVLAAAGDADLVFVGRSPESIYDLLSGALATTSFRERLQLLQLSIRDHPLLLDYEGPGTLARLGSYLDAVSLSPRKIMARECPVVFVDLVCSGATFGNLGAALRELSGARWRSLRERVRWICIVSREHGDWELDDSRWTRHFRGAVHRVVIDDVLWDYLGNEQEKTTPSYTPAAWGSAVPAAPLDGDRACALTEAHALYRLGERSRARLAARLDALEIFEHWIRTLVRELARSPPVSSLLDIGRGLPCDPFVSPLPSSSRFSRVSRSPTLPVALRSTSATTRRPRATPSVSRLRPSSECSFRVSPSPSRSISAASSSRRVVRILPACKARLSSCAIQVSATPSRR